MATPVLSATTNKSSYVPGEALTVTWTVVDEDNSTDALTLEGTDGEGNAVSITLTINRQDTFNMDRVYWVRTNTNLSINQATRTATGTVPSV